MSDPDPNTESGLPPSAEKHLDAVYDQLRELAERKLRRERSDHTLQPTALVHEAYLRLADHDKTWASKTHFYAVAAKAMHRILVDHARGRNRQKRGGEWRKIALDDAFAAGERSELDVTDLMDALDTMRKLDERQARVVELRLFGALSAEETAELLGVSGRTVERDWKMGQAWLRRQLSRETEG